MDGAAITLEPPSPHSGQHSVLRRNVLIGGAALGTAVLIAASAYTMGSHRTPAVRHLSGTAYVGLNQATVKTGGWAYGITPGTPWLRGSVQHESNTMPACLTAVGTTQRISFGAVSFPGPNGGTWRQVVWVRCPR